LALATGTNAETIVTAIESLQGVPGRMQLIGENTSGGTIYVDYAHKPDALRHALLALRPHATGRLITVFGCGGDRDVEKRPEMGRIANEFADDIYVTDDNPRGEDPAMIRRTILQACPGAIEIGDRRDAITQALARLGDGDILMVAGKGHETGQIVGGQVLPFDDAEVVRDVIGGGA
jgi:UDP-N-acetylmuramoyl-L-alanyl-D-glutamate--2,6-diaminopimelate ligase